ncbi:MAG: DNA methylase [Carnobacterium sp.]|nr:DNA methylase [Carnobacterium sp.]
MHIDNEQIAFNFSDEKDQEVFVLGLKFANENERRKYFQTELRKKLPELKQLEGYPKGDDDSIIELSDPPFYTACPNPWLNDFTELWASQKEDEIDYEREPFSADVSEGKNDPIYNAHSYHTKVPYKAIMRYILQYTNPGDIVFDAFSGSGMTGVAAEMCGDMDQVRELGYSQEFIEKKGGKRNFILSDISPAATFIGYNYNKSANPNDIETKLNLILSNLKRKNRWKYVTLYGGNKDLINLLMQEETVENVETILSENSSSFGEINYVVWSEVYICPSCNNELTYWEATVDPDNNAIVTKEMNCYYCGAQFEKKNVEKLYTTHYDKFLRKTIEQPKVEMVKISYFKPDGKRSEKIPDDFDKKLVGMIAERKLDNVEFIAQLEFQKGSETDRLINQGINQVYDLYYPRALNLFGELFCKGGDDADLQFLFGSTIPKMTKLNRFMPQHGSRALVGPMANALYVPPLSVENNFIKQLEFQKKKIIKAYNNFGGGVITTQSSTTINLPNNSVDYMFFDPPFGSNINYSELSYAREAWLKIITEDKYEAIENKKRGKTLGDYTNLMSRAFKEAYRTLKPNRWITVEFSNTQASVWNALQFVIQNAGFIIASVDALDKKRGGFHAMITTTAVKQDLVISAYKPSLESVKKMNEEKNSEESAWTFIDQHLNKLPVFLGNRGKASVIVERTPRILYDRMIAYHVQMGFPVPISSLVFQSGLASRYPMRDGMVFLESQVVEYDKKRILANEFSQLTLFVSDENSAIEWLRQKLMKKPQTRQDIQPHFMKEIMNIEKYEELPELDELLSQNFLLYDGIELVPNQIRTYLTQTYHDLRGLDNSDSVLKEKASHRWYVANPNQQADLDKIREKNLLREFSYILEEINSSKKKLKIFRTEAIRVGFKRAWIYKDYQTIITVGERLPEKVVQEDDKLLMYFDNALMRTEI